MYVRIHIQIHAHSVYICACILHTAVQLYIILLFSEKGTHMCVYLDIYMYVRIYIHTYINT